MSQSFALPMPPGPVPDGRSDSVDLGQVLRALRTRWRWVVIPTVLAAGGAFAYVSTATPRYTAEAKLFLESRDSPYTRPLQEREQAPQFDEQAVASQVQVVMSRDLAREAIKRLKLVGNPEFDPMVGGVGLTQRVKILLGLDKSPFERPPEERILQAYYDRLLVYPVGKSRILAVEFRAEDPDLAASAANTVSEVYLEALEKAKKDTARSASEWLGTNIDGMRSRVAQAEAKVEEFRARSGLLSGPNNASIGAQQLSDLNTQLAQGRSSQADAQAKAKLIREQIKAGRAFEIPDVANNELIRRLLEQRVTLKTQLALELRTLLPGHPRIKELNAQLADLESQVRGAAERTVRTLEAEARIAGARVESIQAAMDAQKKVVAQSNESEVQLRALEREAKVQREQLEAFLVRYREAAARDSENATPPDARIVSRAVTPQAPSFPKKGPIMALATIAAFALFAGGVVARELLVGSPPPPGPRGGPSGEPGPAAALAAEREPAPVERLSRRPMVPSVAPPLAPAHPATAGVPSPLVPAAVAAVAAEPHGATAPVVPAPGAAPAGAPGEERWSFDPLIARLSRQEPADRGRRVLVTGERGEGAAGLARALGRALARERRAILIHLDGAGEGGSEPGFTDLVAGEASFFEIIGRDPGTRLHTVPAGTLDGALLAAEWEGLDIALTAFDQTYDWVLCVLHGAGEGGLLALAGARADAVVIASDEEPDHPGLVDLYNRAKGSGAGDVLVAREEPAAERAA